MTVPEIIEDLTINDGNIAADGSVVEFDLRIPSRWKKILYINITQLEPGPMDISFQVWEKSNIDETTRANLIYNKIRRDIIMTAEQGGTYGESMMGDPIPYKDRDIDDENRDRFIHCRLSNEAGGTASDFAVQLIVADMKERV